VAPRRLQTQGELDDLQLMRASFRDVFGATEPERNRSQRLVLAYLARACRAQESLVAEGEDGEIQPLRTVALASKQELWTKVIRHHLDLSDEEIEIMARYLAHHERGAA